jgi:Concanavalin A-like lectin/glucanases superfamily
MSAGAGMLSLALLPAALAAPGMTDLLGAWPLDEGRGQVAADISGAGHTGRLGALAGPDADDPDWVAGRLGKALRFDGERNQHVEISAHATLRPARLTVDGWIRRLGTPGRWRYVFSGGASGCHAAPYGLYSGPGGGLAFYVSDDAHYVLSPEAAPASVWDGAWHHAAGTYDGARVRLYVDGAEVGAGSATGLTIGYGAGGAFMGTYRGSCDLPYSGDIDEVGVNGVAVGAHEVAARARRVAQQPLPPQAPPVSGPPAQGKATTGQQTGPAPRPSAPKCLRVSVLPNRIRVRKRTPVRVTVRRAGRPAAGLYVTVRGAGFSKRVRTGRKGRVRLVVRAGRLGRVRVRPSSQSRTCRAPVVTVVSRGS